LAILSQSQRVVQFLSDNPKEKFTARAIAESLVDLHFEEYKEKRNNPRFANDKAFITQIAAEIGAQKNQIAKHSRHVFWQDKPRPRIYWFDPDKTPTELDIEDEANAEDDEDTEIDTSIATSQDLSENDLYPLLIDYLKSELALYCQRIDEKRSKNSRGAGGNHWLHPDIVAIQPIDKEWNELVRSCVQQGSGQNVRLWSFEVKKVLNAANVRKSYFQAVSNSSWANEGYLVAATISSTKIEKELRILSALHGIGVILLNPENPSESDILFPAQTRSEVDWQSTDRILTENDDFKDFIELVSTYYQTGRLRSKDWNKT